MTPRTSRAVLAAMMLTFLLIDADVALARRAGATVDEFLDLNVKPFAIGHRGFGENLGEDPDPSLPIENTLRSVRRAFRSGISVVEIDVQVTSDHEVVVFHDDFFSQDVAAPPTCLNTLTRAGLQERLPLRPDPARGSRRGQALQHASGTNQRAGDHRAQGSGTALRSRRLAGARDRGGRHAGRPRCRHD